MTSWPERVLLRKAPLDANMLARADAVRRHVVAVRLGGTWWGAAPTPRRRCGRIVFASRNPETTRHLLWRAMDSGDAAGTMLVLPRPSFLARTAEKLGVTVLVGSIDPWPLLEDADRLYAAYRSDVMLAGRFLGKPVICQRSGPLVAIPNLNHLAAASLILGARYANPFTGEPSSCENFLDILFDMRRGQRTRSSITCCVGISFWKRRRVAAFVGPGPAPSFRKTAASATAVVARRGGAIAVWPSRAPAELAAMARNAGIPVLQMEDGFVRSVGLGADFLPPLSLVIDRKGIYYDATSPSDLETLLATATFPPGLLRRAAALRERLVADRVTKYNLPADRHPNRPAAARVVLVPGQVADDRSVLLGGGGVQPGLDLLQRVRRQAPDAHIIYKPHPDVAAGHRIGAIPDMAVLAIADQILHGGSMADLLDMVDEVHTLTSLTGFEALVRHKPVMTYGQPFYAGWGLTTDLQPLPRRGRRLTLDELVAGTMILYPNYIDPVTLLPCGPETAMDRLRDPTLIRTTWLVRARRFQGRVWEHARRAGWLPHGRGAGQLGA